jgi:lipopolysaccharide export LptBFGC system permease protein LptF
MLQMIYTLALGLITAAFVEIGIFTFLRRPESKNVFYKDATSEEAQRFEQKRYDRERREQENYWGLVALVSLVVATILVALALLLPKKVGVIADGVMLGSVFTLMCGVGAGIFGGGRVAKFVVAFVSLALTLALGYFKFAQ